MKKFITNNNATILLAGLHDIPEGADSLENISQYPNASKNRIHQLAASHYLVQSFYGEGESISRSATGKPSLVHSQNYLSISHNPNSIGIITAEYPVAIDIELITRNVSHVAKKFTTSREVDLIQEDFCVNREIVVWTQKECLFKIMKVDGVDFKSHLILESVNQKDGRLRSKYQVNHPDDKDEYWIESFIFEETIISYIDRSIKK